LLVLAAASAVVPPPAASTPDIVVKGQRPVQRAQTRKAVGTIAKPAAQGGFGWQYARWDEPVCMMVAGLPAAGGRFVADRIGQIARRAGAEVEEPGCRPNIYVIIAPDPAAFVSGATKKRAGLLQGLGGAEIARLGKSNDPVRWASVTTVTSSQGDPMIKANSGAGGASFGNARMNTLAQWRASTIYASTSTHLARMVVLVDGRRAQGLSYRALADYIGLVSLAQLQPGADATMVDSILSLFRGKKDAPTGLTRFDTAFLHALYTVDPAMPGETQRQMIIGAIDRALATMSAP